jgi:hypothetical protein
MKLTVETVPENARVLVDGALLPANGDMTGFAKDNAMHKVRAEAPGFRAKMEWVRFDSEEVTVQINLDPASRKGRKDGKDALPPSALGEGPTPGAPGSLAQTPASTPMREIDASGARRRSSSPVLDTADPWKK